MKAVILAGGSGTRLYPVTQTVNKHFLPIYNKPMIYYPISLVMLLKIKEVVFVINPQDYPFYSKLFHHLTNLGMKVEYVFQDRPNGLAEGLILADKYIKDSPVMYLLGDNILYGHNVWQILDEAKTEVITNGGSYIFGYAVKDPHRFGVVEFDRDGNVLSIEEKPKHPKSNFAVIGIYFFDKDAVNIAKKVNPSDRGELEITSVLEHYLKEKRLKVKLLGRGYAWFDAGTHDSFLEAGEFVATIENRTGLMIGCIEEVAYRNGWLNRKSMMAIAERMKKTEYGKYLLQIIEEEDE